MFEMRAAAGGVGDDGVERGRDRNGRAAGGRSSAAISDSPLWAWSEPQQACDGGVTTAQPLASRTSAVSRLTSLKMRSWTQPVSRPTRYFGGPPGRGATSSGAMSSGEKWRLMTGVLALQRRAGSRAGVAITPERRTSFCNPVGLIKPEQASDETQAPLPMNRPSRTSQRRSRARAKRRRGCARPRRGPSRRAGRSRPRRDRPSRRRGSRGRNTFRPRRPFRFQLAVGDGAHEGDAAARAVALDLGLHVGGTGGQAHAAVHALLEHGVVALVEQGLCPLPCPAAHFHVKLVTWKVGCQRQTRQPKPRVRSIKATTAKPAMRRIRAFEVMTANGIPKSIIQKSCQDSRVHLGPGRVLPFLRRP